MFNTLTLKPVLLLVFLRSLIGCVSKSNVDYGKQFTDEQINQIQKNSTTA